MGVIKTARDLVNSLEQDFLEEAVPLDEARFRLIQAATSLAEYREEREAHNLDVDVILPAIFAMIITSYEHLLTLPDSRREIQETDQQILDVLKELQNPAIA